MITFIPAIFYRPLYLIFVSILTLVVYNKYSKLHISGYRYIENDTMNVILVIFFSFFIGLRPVNGLFVDMCNYRAEYDAILEGAYFSFDWHAENLIFDNLFALFGSLYLGYKSFFLLIAIIYFACSYLGIKRIFPKDKLTAYLVFLGAYSTYSYGVNGIKSGAATSIFIWAYSYRQNLKMCIPLILISWGFHHSMQLPVAAFILSIFYKNSKLYFYAWCFCLLMAVAHVGVFASLFAGMSDESGAGYIMGGINGKDGTKGGFRLDFILYSLMPVLIGYYAIFKKKLRISEKYRDLLNLYLCTNGVWMLCMYANFTNRIAYLSWFIYPIVLIYPLLYEDLGSNKYRIFSKVILLHLLFTIIMSFV